MHVYKDGQFLIFELDNGDVVKYDFARKVPIGKSGMRVTNLKRQLSGISIEEICNSCSDPGYGNFLRFVKAQGGYNGVPIKNIGTILENVPRFARFEQIFSAGVKRVDPNLRYEISNIPSGLLKICRGHGIRLSNNVVENYKKNPDAYTIMFNMKFESLTDFDFETMLEYNYNRYGCECISKYMHLIKQYGYQPKALLLYIDHLKTYEAIENIQTLLNELVDYARMMSAISNKFDRYPRHFLTTHRIAARNYNRLKIEFEESLFIARRKEDMETIIAEYAFIYPKSTQDIKDEAVQQNNCVASYIQRVIDGKCDIIFMRDKSDIGNSLVTLEVVDGKIVQAKRHFNYPVTENQQRAIDKWNKWYATKNKELNKVA